MISFSFSSVLKIHDQVALFPSFETGGLLVGIGTSVMYALPAENEADDPKSAFVIGGEQLAALVDSIGDRENYHLAPDGLGWSEPRLELLGSYHSHPNGRADLSPGDAALAEVTGLLLLVAPGPTWQWRLWNPAAGGAVDQVTIAWPNVLPHCK
jgi:hypothetical protein